MRDHEPIVIEEFNGWYDRGDAESTPLDHFNQADNVQYGNSSVMTRDPLDKYQTVPTPLQKIIRIYNYVMQTGQSLLVLTDGGKIYHIVSPGVMHGPILTIPTMEDFGFVAYNGRAYITPFKTNVDTLGMNYELGLPNEFLYVYKGDGTPARKAAGQPPKNDIAGAPQKPFLAFNSATTGKIFAGIHVFAVAFNGGALGLHTAVDAPGEKQIQLENIPIGPGGTTSRTIVGTQAISHDVYKPADHATYTYYVVEVIADNTTTSKVVDIADDDTSGAHPVYTPGGGTAPSLSTGGLTIRQSETTGFCDFGFHLIGVVYETDTGYLSSPGPQNFGGYTYTDVKKAIDVSGIPVSPDSFVKKRHLVSTKWIPEYNGDQKGYQFFFIPEGTIDNNTDTAKTVSYYDSDLLADASHLIDNFAEVPAGVALTTYHGRMVLVGFSDYPKKADGTPDTTQPDNRSVARLSEPGEPEAFNQVDGLIIAPLDGNPLTNCQEFRDILYLFKKTRTIAYVDNEDTPASWLPEKIDEGIGAPVHGIATVLDTGGVNVDYLLIADWSGFMLFNGTYARPELSWKIEDFWIGLNRNQFRFMQVVNDSISKKMWITLPEPYRHMMLYTDYGNGLDPQKIKWARWIFDVKVSCVALIESNKLMIGALENATS